MQEELAARILTRTMDWKDSSRINQEIEDIQIIAEMKYDDYQQYTHGQRYIEKLSMWLSKFENKADRELAYKFIKENLIFISEKEMWQLVSVAFEMFMKPVLMEKTKEFCSCRAITDIRERKDVFKFFRRSALFLGLSDGSHMDYFRRHNKQLSHEQVFVHYDFSKKRAQEMNEKLIESNDYHHLKDRYLKDEGDSFHSVFLLDDFSGSGKSYIRYDMDENEWKGKIITFIKLAKELNMNFSQMDIHVVLYVATRKALAEIRDNIKEYCMEQENRVVQIEVNAVQIVNKMELIPGTEIFEWLSRDFAEMKKRLNGDEDYIDNHYRKGDITYPFLGFDGCSLALVINHNTPNNSFPVIWFESKNETALFPRITRHKEE